MRHIGHVIYEQRKITIADSNTKMRLMLSAVFMRGNYLVWGNR